MTSQMQEAMDRLQRWLDENISPDSIRREALRDLSEAAIGAQDAVRFLSDERDEKAIETILIIVRQLNNARMALVHLRGRGAGT